jgi:hypothetical protein
MRLISVSLLLLGIASGAAQQNPPRISLVPYLPPGIRQFKTLGLAVAVQGTPPLHYQWQFNGQDVMNATNAQLTLTNVQPVVGYDPVFGPGSLEGEYSVSITNAFGVATHSWRLLVQPVPRIVAFQPGASIAVVTWRGGIPPYQVERSLDLSAGVWEAVATMVNDTNATVNIDSKPTFYRVSGSSIFNPRSITKRKSPERDLF